MNMNPWLHNRKLMKQITPAKRFKDGCNFYEWQKDARECLSGLLGLDLFSRCEELFKIEYKKKCDGFTEYRFTIQSEEGYFFPSVLRIPDGEGAFPLIICLQGHSTGMHISLGETKFTGDEELISDGDRDFTVRAVKEGCAALALEQRCFGECGAQPNGKPDCAMSSMTAIMLGRTTIGERVWDVSRAIDAIENHFSDIINTNEIYLMGNSGGGTATYYAAAIETRIKCAMPSCSVCTWEESITAVPHCVCNYVPGIAKYFDMGDIGGLIAPRGLVVVNGALDDIFTSKGVADSFAITKSLYIAAGVPENCAHVEGPGDHRFYADLSWPVFNKIRKEI